MQHSPIPAWRLTLGCFGLVLWAYTFWRFALWLGRHILR